MFVGAPSLSLCMLSTRQGCRSEGIRPRRLVISGGGDLGWVPKSREGWQALLDKEGEPQVGGTVPLGCQCSPEEGEARRNRARELLVGLWVTGHPAAALGPQLEILGPCHGWEEPARPGVRPP